MNGDVEISQYISSHRVGPHLQRGLGGIEPFVGRDTRSARGKSEQASESRDE
jgi:hypothetical protein